MVPREGRAQNRREQAQDRAQHGYFPDEIDMHTAFARRERRAPASVKIADGFDHDAFRGFEFNGLDDEIETASSIIVTARCATLSSKVGMPSILCEPSAFGM